MKLKSHQSTCLHGPQSKSKRIYDNVGHKSSKKVPSLLFKRASRCSTSILKSYTGKAEYVEIKGGRQQMHPAALIACPGKVLTEKCKKDSVCQRLSGYKDMNRPRGRRYIACSDSSNDSSSIGSCSLNSWRQDGPFESSARHLYLERNLLYNDAESIYCSADQEDDNRDDCSEEKAEVSVHSLELHAYRCTVAALFVSGPLSWEQEELLTNLRICLHISNDEHLTVLRNLIASGTSK